MPSPGDILFFKGSDQKFIDRLIMARTRSWCVHVEVVLTNSPKPTAIGALSGGVNIHPIPTSYAASAPTGVVLSQKDPERLQAALQDLTKRAGDVYGWGDIVSQVLMMLPGHPDISFNRSEDCSDLVTQFLLAAGYRLPFGTAPDRVVPGDLVKWLDVQIPG
jgi:hypothetical protein